MNMQVINTARAADAGFGLAVAGTGVSWLADFSVVVQVIAGGIAIIAGVFAALYHYEGWREHRRKLDNHRRKPGKGG